MEELKNLYPADLNEKDCSADFVECLADYGSVVWNRKEAGEFAGLFFFKNKYVITRYRDDSNSISFEFEQPGTQKNDFLEMLKEDFFNDDCEVLVKIFEPEVKKNSVVLFFYFKPETLA